MAEIYPGGLASLDGGVLQAGLGIPVVAVPTLPVAGNFYPAAPDPVIKRVSNAGLGVGATQVLWTPAAGFRVWINSIMIFVASVGAWTFKIDATDILYYRVIDNKTNMIEFPPHGLAIATVNGVLQVTNNTGLGSQLEVTVFGKEY